MATSPPSVNYQALEKDRLVQSRAALRQKLKSLSENDLGKIGGLRREILGPVVSERYDLGKHKLEAYVETRAIDYPGFDDRVAKFVKHACDLILAIQTKRSFPGLGSLSLGKQQEIAEKVLIHYQELKQTLKAIERAEKDVKLSDMRATSWTITTFANAILGSVTVAFLLDLHGGLWYSFQTVFAALVDDVVSKVELLLHWH